MNGYNVTFFNSLGIKNIPKEISQLIRNKIIIIYRIYQKIFIRKYI